MNAKLEKGIPTAPQEILSRCLVEGDDIALARMRRARRRALLVSLALESTLLAALTLLPLLATGQRPVLHQIVPVPPFGPGPRVNPKAAPKGAAPRPVIRDPDRPVLEIFQPPRIPEKIGSGDQTALGGNTSEGGLGIGPPRIEGGINEPGATTPPWLFKSLTELPPPAGEKRIKRSEGVQEALLINRVVPGYPALARQVHLEGAVRLRAIIDREGRVSSLEVLSGHPLLAQVALDAVSRWRYRPTLLNGQPVEVETYITVIFQLRR